MASEATLEKVMMLLSAAYPTSEIAEQTPSLYFRLLADIPDDLLEAAVLDHISRNIFYPKVAELRSAVAKLSYCPQPAMEAWRDVCDAIRYLGHSGNPEFKNPITARVVSAMGWRELCQSINQTADRARFIDAYDYERSRELEAKLTLPMVVKIRNRLTSGREESGWVASHFSLSKGGRIEYVGGKVRDLPALEAGDGNRLD